MYRSEEGGEKSLLGDPGSELHQISGTEKKKEKCEDTDGMTNQKQNKKVWRNMPI